MSHAEDDKRDSKRVNGCKRDFKVKNLNIHTYRELLLTEICRRTRMHVAEHETQTEDESTSYNNLQEVLDDILNDEEEALQTPSSLKQELDEEVLQALTSINQESERIQESIEDMIEETPTIYQGLQEPDLSDFQTLMELSLDNEEHDDLLVVIPHDKIIL